MRCFDRGAQVDIRSTNAMKNTPLHAAARADKLRSWNCCWNAAPTRTRGRRADGRRCTGPRRMATANGRSLLANGADVNARAGINKARSTWRSMKGHQEVASILEALGAAARIMADSRLEELRRSTLAAFASAGSLEELEKARVEALGRKGALAQISKEFGKIATRGARPTREAAEFGEAGSRERHTKSKKRRFEQAELAERLAGEWIDVTLPAPGIAAGQPASRYPASKRD